MDLKLSEWAVFLCFCAFGIQSSLSFIQNMREIEQNCARDGGFCINIHVPQPPRRRGQGNRRQPGVGARGGFRGAGAGAGAAPRRGTRTRKGSRPDPRALGQQHTRLPGAAAPAAAPAAPGLAAAAPPAYAPAAPTQTAPQNQNNGFLFGGNSPNDPFGGLFGMMMFGTRKKRQATQAMTAEQIAEYPRRTKKETVFSYLNAHCRKSEFDFGCRNEGGMCCLPFLK